MKETIVYILYLITQPDIMDTQLKIHQIVFGDKKSCIHMAEVLQQEHDPVVKKPNCTKVESYGDEG